MQGGVVIRLKDLPNKPTGVFNSSKKREQVASIAQKASHKPSKKKSIHHKEIENRLKKSLHPLS